MSRLPNGFISLGTKESWLNIDCIDQSKCYLDKRINKVAVIDKFGNRFNVEPKLLVGKIKWRE